MPLNNLGLVCEGLWRCAQPDQDGFTLLGGLNVTTIIKLNDNGEYPDSLEKTNFKGDVICDPYPRLFIVPAEANVVSTVQKIVNLLSAGKCVAVHCTHGVDRTGLVIGAFRIIQSGWTLDKVKAERRLYGSSFLRDIPDHLILELLEAIEADHAARV
jgi:protein tyrosine/serine phosphatase